LTKEIHYIKLIVYMIKLRVFEICENFLKICDNLRVLSVIFPKLKERKMKEFHKLRVLHAIKNEVKFKTLCNILKMYMRIAYLIN
jgi:hypothetical protein